MFGKNTSKRERVHIAEVAMGSGLDYFAASTASEGSDRASFLVLAHRQLAGSAVVWAEAQKEDKSLYDQYLTAEHLTDTIGSEIRRLVEKGLAAGADEPFPFDQGLRERTQAHVAGGLGVDSLSVGAEAAWTQPFLNVYHGPPASTSD